MSERLTNQPLALRALWYALGATAYIALVAVFFANVKRLFGGEETFLHQLAFPLLLVFSVLVMGMLLLVPSLRLYLDGKKSEGVRLLRFTVMWMGAMTLLAMIVLASS